MRAALYARVSKDDRGQDSRNLRGQLQMCREYAERQGHEVVAELAEDERGARGAVFDLPEVNRMLELAEMGAIDIVIVREVDRLARDLGKARLVEDELAKAGVKLDYALYDFPDSLEGRLQKNMYASFAEYEAGKINERMVRGRRQKVKAGHVIAHGRPPYGYRLGTVDGKRTFIIHEEEARIVRLVFEWYTAGAGDGGPLSFYGIAKKLSEMRVPTAADRDKRIVKERGYGEWSRNSVRVMVSREAYAGLWYYGKRSNRGINDRAHWIPVEVPAIVDRSTWEEAQKRIRQNLKEWPRNVKYPYLLPRRVFCDSCGCKMHPSYTGGSSGLLRYYNCPAAAGEYATKCDVKTCFRLDYVEDQVWAWIRELFGNPTVALQGMREEQTAREDQIGPLRRRLQGIDDALQAGQRDLERLVNKYLDDELVREILIQRKEEIQQSMESQKRERKVLETRIANVAITDEQITELSRYIGQLGEGLQAAEGDFAKRRRLIEELDVTVRLAIEDGEQILHVACLVGRDSLAVSPTITGTPGRSPSSASARSG